MSKKSRDKKLLYISLIVLTAVFSTALTLLANQM